MPNSSLEFNWLMWFDAIVWLTGRNGAIAAAHCARFGVRCAEFSLAYAPFNEGTYWTNACGPAWPEPRCALRGRGERRERAHEGLGRTVVSAQPEAEPAACVEQMPGAVAQLLHHRRYASALDAAADGCIGPEQSARGHQAQDVNRHRAELAHDVVRIELARPQPSEIEVGLELGVELLVCAVVGIGGGDVLGLEGGGQARRPALQRELGHKQRLAPLVDGPLDEAQYPANSPHDGRNLHRLLPGGQALARAWRLPARGRVGIEQLGQRRHIGAARVPLDEEVHLRFAREVAPPDAQHHAHGVEAPVQPRQDRRFLFRSMARRAQALGQRDHALEVEVGLAGGVLQARAQRQFQAKPVRAKVGRQRAVAIDTGIGAAHAFLGRATVVHREGIHVQRQPAAGLHTVVRAPRAKRGIDQRRDEVEHLGYARIHALAQLRAGRQQRHALACL